MSDTETRAPVRGAERIAAAFAAGKAFVGFVTAGDPSIEATEGFIVDMAEAGCDVIEVGIPFSDPVAEGPVIQEADLRALSGGATTDDVLAMVARVRQRVDVPLVFMGYYNTMYSYAGGAVDGIGSGDVLHGGTDRFFAECERVGIDGVIVPDLPYEESGEIRGVAHQHGVAVVSMVAPTSHDRIRRIAADSEGFLYVVSSLGVTGVRKHIETDLGSILRVVREATDTPAAVGFGISTSQQARDVAAVADGAIVGSAIVRIIARDGADAGPAIREYVAAMKAGVLAAA